MFQHTVCDTIPAEAPDQSAGQSHGPSTSSSASSIGERHLSGLILQTASRHPRTHASWCEFARTCKCNPPPAPPTHVGPIAVNFQCILVLPACSKQASEAAVAQCSCRLLLCLHSLKHAVAAMLHLPGFRYLLHRPITTNVPMHQRYSCLHFLAHSLPVIAQTDCRLTAACTA